MGPHAACSCGCGGGSSSLPASGGAHRGHSLVLAEATREARAEAEEAAAEEAEAGRGDRGSSGGGPALLLLLLCLMSTGSWSTCLGSARSSGSEPPAKRCTRALERAATTLPAPKALSATFLLSKPPTTRGGGE